MAERSAARQWLQRWLSHPLQAGAVHAVFAIVRLLDLDRASALGGWIGRTIGPRLSASNRARTNLRRAMPELDAPAREAVVRAMWENLGRTAFEYPRLHDIRTDANAQVDIVGGDIFEAAVAHEGPVIFFSGHFANWEVVPLTAGQRGVPIHLVYRAPDNPWVQSLFEKRKPHPDSHLIPKGAAGARKTMALLRAGGRFGILVDQKMNDGIAVPFFGIDAMTAPAIAQFALKLGCLLIPVQNQRLDGARFRITFHPPLDIPDTGNRHQDVAAIMAAVNRHLEDWIRAAPGQWFWLHKRWPDA